MDGVEADATSCEWVEGCIPAERPVYWKFYFRMKVRSQVQLGTEGERGDR